MITDFKRTPCCGARYKDKWNTVCPGRFSLVKVCSKCGREYQFIGELKAYEKYILGDSNDNKTGI